MNHPHTDDTIRFRLHADDDSDPLAVAEGEPYGVARLSDRALLENITATFERALQGRQHYQLVVDDGRSRPVSQDWVPIDASEGQLQHGLKLQVEQLISEWRYAPQEAAEKVPWNEMV